MRIPGLVGLLMMHPVRGDPEDRPAFQRQRPADREYVLEPLRYGVGAMRMQPVVAHADTQPRAEPVKEESGGKRLPVKHEKSGDSADVEQSENNNRAPIQAHTWRKFDRLLCHGSRDLFLG